ncbi:MAG: hypothetical protein RMM98_09325 [Acidobacteriota bacterium]|nr:hypothetical protein [Blastocatellia bacterium]MDW8239805.1 hypothetical protein [Acidobacteriota bacterium]
MASSSGTTRAEVSDFLMAFGIAHTTLVFAKPRKQFVTTLPDVQRLEQSRKQHWRVAEAPERRVCGQRLEGMNELMRERMALLQSARD